MRPVERVCAVLAALSAPFALIGARALGIRGYPRMTIDYDLLTVDRRVLSAAVWAELARDGLEVAVRRGELDDPLAGVVRVTDADASEVDVVVGRWDWQREVVARAERLDLGGGLQVPVATRSDLVLLKLGAGGVLDLQDVVALLSLGHREQTVREVDERIAALGTEATAVWQRLRSQQADRG